MLRVWVPSTRHSHTRNDNKKVAKTKLKKHQKKIINNKEKKEKKEGDVVQLLIGKATKQVENERHFLVESHIYRNKDALWI